MTSSVAPPIVSEPAAAAIRPRLRARWALPAAPDPDAIRSLATDLHLPEVVCRLLLARHHGATDSAKRFLRPRLDQLHDPSSLLGLDRAVERVVRAIHGGETILIHGDYDVDGICATTLLTRSIRAFGGLAAPFIPRRIEDGYDLSMAGVDAAVREGATVVITADCGTSALEPVAALCRLGIDVIVTDHHLPGGALPDCLAVLNPKQPGCEYPDKDLAAVGVAFKLALGVARALGANENIVLHMLDLVALATIADIAPLRGENRVLARYGLKLLSDTQNPGLRALIRASGLEGKALTAGRIGYILAPRLNAVGRLDHALRGVELLMTTNEHDANVLARDFEELNRRRQALDRATQDEAREMVAALDLEETWGIVLAKEGWHPGVIGIVASRIVEETGRPTILIALHDGEGKGSGRSIPAFDLHSALGTCRQHLVRFGGHKAAAGVTVSSDRVGEFARCFNQTARARLTAEDLVPELRVDLELSIDDANVGLEALLRHFEPFGIGNAAPVFVARGVRLSSPPRVIGRDGLKLRLSTAAGELEAIGWGMGWLASTLDMKTPIDVAFRLESEEWNGENRLQAKLADVHW